MEPEIVERNGKQYEIRCARCKSPEIRFDAHAGFAICQKCGWDTERTGPEGAMFEVGTGKCLQE